MAGVNLRDKLDPWKHAEQLSIKIVYADEIEGLTSEQKRFINQSSAKDWSGGAMSKSLPDGRTLVILHPNQTDERANVTILEEVAHKHFDHEPSILTGDRAKAYDDAAEQEAYWTAAAMLLPMKEVARAVYVGQSAEELGASFGVSQELAEMRIKIMGLWEHYKARQTPG